MGRPSQWWLVWFALLSACAADEPRSLVLVTVDTLRADHLGCYGYFRDTSPSIDRFAAEAVLFENALTPMATTLPAHFSLMTGTRPPRHRIFHNLPTDDGVSSDLPVTLAELLARAGYQTAAFVSAAPLKDHTGIDAGFSHFDQPEGRERRARETTDRVVAWLETREPGPFFLWVHYFDPHDPYDPPMPWRERFQTGPDLLAFLRARGVADPDDKLLGINNRYDGEISYLDGQLERLFGALRAAGPWEDAVVVLAADHGEGLGQHGWVGHGRIYNEQLFVPLIVKLPGGRSGGTRETRFVSLIDVLPTLARELGLALEPRDAAQLEGVDLFDRGAGRDFVYSERVHRDRDWEPGRKYALTGPEWKFFHLSEGSDQLYDMRADRFESRDLAAGHPDLAARLRDRIAAIVSEGERHARAQAPQELPPERLEELRQLGYVDEEVTK